MAEALAESAVEQIVEVTGASTSEAQYFLAASGNNVEAAISLYFEQGGGGADRGGETDEVNIVEDAAPVVVAEDDVRAPIAPVREQLIGPEDDNFMATGSSGMHSTAASRIVRPSQRVKVCPFRDFAREAAVMEEQLYAAADGNIDGNTVSTTSSAHADALNLGSRRRIARAVFAPGTNMGPDPRTSKLSAHLGDLFRPPTDIAYAGTFQAARARATAVKHWLLVNVQSDNFDSQLLNRDVWSNKEIRKLLRRNFLLWQIDADSSEGRRFITFYHCAKLPYVSVIDPRTGEEVWKTSEPKESTMLADLQRFLREHKDFEKECDDDTPSTSKRTAAIACDVDNDDDVSKGPADTCSGSAEKRSKIMELTEEEQIALAIKNSIQENGMAKLSSNGHKKGVNDATDGDESDFESLEEFGDDDIKGACERISYEEKLGQAKDQLTMLKIRLLNTSGSDETVELRWPSDTSLEVLHLYLKQNQPHIAKQNYKLICAFPRKTFSSADDGSSLKSLGLHPSANIHVTMDD